MKKFNFATIDQTSFAGDCVCCLYKNKNGKLVYSCNELFDTIADAWAYVAANSDKVQITNIEGRRLVVNEYGVELDFKATTYHMDDDLSRELSSELAPCTEQEFFDAYAAAHLAKFGEEWELAKANPIY
jgi:hypothetical protein|nr:MAG TPA: hypothetical protein [Caudoviricetes sp.]